MQIDPPTWELVETCPCCGQGGLMFFACSQCSRVVLVCAEVGTVFPDVRDRSRTSELSAPCPSCKSGRVVDFDPATSAQVQALGFAPDEYR